MFQEKVPISEEHYWQLIETPAPLSHPGVCESPEIRESVQRIDSIPKLNLEEQERDGVGDSFEIDRTKSFDSDSIEGPVEESIPELNLAEQERHEVAGSARIDEANPFKRSDPVEASIPKLHSEELERDRVSDSVVVDEAKSFRELDPVQDSVPKLNSEEQDRHEVRDTVSIDETNSFEKSDPIEDSIEDLNPKLHLKEPERHQVRDSVVFDEVKPCEELNPAEESVPKQKLEEQEKYEVRESVLIAETKSFDESDPIGGSVSELSLCDPHSPLYGKTNIDFDQVKNEKNISTSPQDPKAKQNWVSKLDVDSPRKGPVSLTQVSAMTLTIDEGQVTRIDQDTTNLPPDHLTHEGKIESNSQKPEYLEQLGKDRPRLNLDQAQKDDKVVTIDFPNSKVLQFQNVVISLIPSCVFGGNGRRT